MRVNKIGIDSRAAIWYRGTGMGTYTYQLMRNIYLIDKKNDYHFFLPNEKFQGIDPLRGGVFQSISQTRNSFWESVAETEINPLGMDLYHIPQNGIGLPKEKSCPLIVTIHDLIPYILPNTVGKRYLSIFQEQMPKVIAMADQIITVSNHSKNDLIKILQVPAEKIKVIYEAPETIYKPLNPDLVRSRIKSKYRLEDDFILYLGGFSPRKNLLGLVQAYAGAYQKFTQPTKLVIIGRPSPNLDSITDFIRKNHLQEQVVFLGFAPMQDLPFLYNASKLFVYPSFYEGFGLPPLEALACGTPVVTGNISSLPEIMGDAGILIDPYSVTALTAALVEGVENKDLRQQLIKKGLQRAADFSWTKTAGQTIEVYNGILAKNN